MFVSGDGPFANRRRTVIVFGLVYVGEYHKVIDEGGYADTQYFRCFEHVSERAGFLVSMRQRKPEIE